MTLFQSIFLFIFLAVYLKVASFVHAEPKEYRISSFSEIEKEDIVSRIVGGNLASPGEFPSIVLSGCGGTLIHPDIILTAAHCFNAFYQTTVKIGGIKRDGSDSQKIGTYYFLGHPWYDNKTLVNDIALVVLNSTSNRTLQVMNTNNNVPADNEAVVVAGFGRIIESEYYYGDLRKVSITVVDAFTCYASYGFSTIVDDLMICAGVIGGGQGSCFGDSGGPIYTKNRVQIGITSFGRGCGSAISPGVYTRISSYESWIKENICQWSSVPPAYCSPTRAPVPRYCPCRRRNILCRLIFRCWRP
jgi:secreted trypsin-like serine protease